MKPLPNTAYAVLGLLSFGNPLSGYQIRKEAKQLKYFYWSPAQSQVYAELRRLEERKFVDSKKVRQEGKPDKAMYQITNEGDTALSAWVDDVSAEITPNLKHPLLLKFHFGHMGTTEAQITILQKYISQLEENLSQLYVVEEFASNMPDFEHRAIVVDWGIHNAKSELDFAQSLITKLST